MIRIGTLEQAQRNRRKLTLANGTGYWRSELIGSPPGGPLAPQAFLVEQDADSVILPHFHLQDEFQVVVHGSGSIGRREMRPVSVHYAGAHTGYGPITSGAEGLWYFTLRATTDQGAQFLPEARPRMDPSMPKRHLRGGPASIGGDVATSAVTDVIAPQTDGIAAWLVRLAAHQRLHAPAHPHGLARYYLVLAGALSTETDMLARWSVVFASADEEPFPMHAGAEGAVVLALQFPERQQ